MFKSHSCSPYLFFLFVLVALLANELLKVVSSDSRVFHLILLPLHHLLGLAVGDEVSLLVKVAALILVRYVVREVVRSDLVLRQVTQVINVSASKWTQIKA